MQNDVMMRLIQRVTEDADFRANALLNLKETLKSEGFCLSRDELAAVQAFRTQVLGGASLKQGLFSNIEKIYGP